MEKWRLVFHEYGDELATYYEFNAEHEAVEFLAKYCATYMDDSGYHVYFDGKRAIIETENDVVAFACVFPPMITEEVES